ncbi:MAG: metal ABC transporter permease [Rubrivivax sp.]|nr:metal ABC transporter permease [Rubrivivax sp.]
MAEAAPLVDGLLQLPLPAALWAALIEPFAEFAFMRRGAVACLALALAAAPLGCWLIVRRMSLVGDALSHAVLPGAAAGFWLAGLSLPAMSLGGFFAALMVALGAGFITRRTAQREDAAFAALYLVALALGVLLVSLRGSPVDLMHLLFGSVLAVDRVALLMMAGVASLTLLGLALIWRPLALETADPGFLRHVRGPAALAHAALLVMVVANLVSAFQALGTLMAVGLMMLPAAAARFWAASLIGQCATAAGIGTLAGLGGLLWSWHAELPSGPCIVLLCGAVYGASVMAGRRDSLLRRWMLAHAHRVA